jgi:tetratricopeptide (TPR) repeat protein
MSRMKSVLTLLFACALATPVAAGQQHDHQGPPPERLGTVHFVTSCRADVQPAFDRAVALLHSFWFTHARDAFAGVLERDPGCAIANWGIALTYLGNPFGVNRSSEALGQARTAIAKGLAANPKTPRERDYLAAAAELFKDFETRDQRTRAVAYEQAMARVAKTNPEDTEATIFYALALAQNAPPTDKSYTNLLAAGALLEPLFAKQPDHPGLAHYIIHAYDVPPLAPKALGAARRYAEIAPSAPHALHMPSHTFTRVGAWDESIESNLKSAEAANHEHAVSDEMHAMDYLVYAYLQTARDQAARGVATALEQLLAQLPKDGSTGLTVQTAAGFYAAAAIPARYALERSAWTEAAALMVRPSSTPQVPAITHFARAVGAARTGALDRARADVAAMGELHAALVKNNDSLWAEHVDIQRMVATAWIAFGAGNAAEAERLLRAAADREDATEKSAVTPGPFMPARESLGDLLLELKRPAEALPIYEKNLAKEPNRLKSVFGAAHAAELSGEAAKAHDYFNQLATICARADTPNRAELRAALLFLQKK